MFLKNLKNLKFTLLIGCVIFLTSCEKQKISYKNTPGQEPVILPVQCESCHNGMFPEHSTNAHSKHTTGLYSFACSTCHFEHGYETETHMNDVKNITFDPNGLATRKGADTNSPVYDIVTKTCSNVYCHSNGITADRGHDSTYTWATTFPFINGTVLYSTTPGWDTGKVSDCTYCHNGLGSMNPDSAYQISRPHTMVQGNYPASGQHQRGVHRTNSQQFENPPYATPIWGGVQCFWCHTTTAIDVAAVNGPILQGTYGTNFHVDGETYFKPLNISAGGTMANGLEYSSNGTQTHCGNSYKCWGNP